jgi:hypothetical protein
MRSSCEIESAGLVCCLLSVSLIRSRARIWRSPARSPPTAGAKLAGRSDLRMLCVVADYDWEPACAEAAAQGRVMDRASYRIMAPFHIAETREKAIENVRARLKKWQLSSYSVNPEGGAAIGMQSIEEINPGARGAALGARNRCIGCAPVAKPSAPNPRPPAAWSSGTPSRPKSREIA